MRHFLIVFGLMASSAARAEDQPALGFDEALRLMTTGNTSVKQAEEAAAGAAAREDGARYLYLPSVAAEARETRTAADEPTGPEASRTAGITANVNLYRFGGDQAKIDAAKATASAAHLRVRATVLDTELKAAEALFDVISLEKERQIAQGFVAVRRDSAAVVRHLYEKGARPAQEAEKTEIDAANEEARLADTDVRLAAARAALARLAGRPLNVKSDWPWTDYLAKASVPSLTGATPDFSQRPERQALVEEARALELGLRDIRARRLPSLDASVGYDVLRQSEPDVKATEWSGALILTVPLFDRFAARSEAEEQAHRQAAAELEVTAKDYELKASFEEARSSLASALASAKTRDKTLAAARALYERSLKGFRSGLLSANELSLDQSRLYETELNAVRGWADVHRFQSRLCRSLGLRIIDCVK